MIENLGLADSVRIINKRSQQELPLFYSKSKVFVLPSIITDSGDRDGIPNVLAEAMAMGLPVISNRLPNISELIEDGKDGILVADKDTRMLAKAIRESLSDEEARNKLGKNAREKIIRDFDAKKHIRKIADLFEKVDLMALP